MKIIIDTDPGHDDAVALMLACKSNALDVLAVTTVAGNSTITNTTRNARYILDFLGRSDVPVFSGASKPRDRILRQAVVHGKSGLEGIDPVGPVRLTNDAPEKILEYVKANPKELIIVALGPLTNIARAIELDPVAMQLVKQIVIMGGAINEPGNMNRVAEFNFFVDPEAADMVMQFPVPKALVPLDACNPVVLNNEDIANVRVDRTRNLLSKMFRPYIANIAKDTGIEGAIMYDPLTIFCLLRPSACKTICLNVQIETAGTITRGMSVVDKRRIGDQLEPNVDVVLQVDRQAFVEFFVRTLSSS